MSVPIRNSDHWSREGCRRRRGWKSRTEQETAGKGSPLTVFFGRPNEPPANQPPSIDSLHHRASSTTKSCRCRRAGSLEKKREVPAITVIAECFPANSPPAGAASGHWTSGRALLNRACLSWRSPPTSPAENASARAAKAGGTSLV